MPLHDWTDDRGWDSVHQLWINALLFWLQDRLPEEYRAYLKSIPDLMTAWAPGRPEMAVHVYRQGQLVAAGELVSPRNKDRPSSREFYRNRYLGYLWSGIHLMLVDVHRRPVGFSFVEAMAEELQCQLPVGPPPHAVSWNVGGSTPEGGRFLDGWYRPLTVGVSLPALPLVLAGGQSLLIDLDQTYGETARHAYLE